MCGDDDIDYDRVRRAFADRAASPGCCARAARPSWRGCWSAGELDELCLIAVAARRRARCRRRIVAGAPGRTAPATLDLHEPARGGRRAVPALFRWTRQREDRSMSRTECGRSARSEAATRGAAAHRLQCRVRRARLRRRTAGRAHLVRCSAPTPRCCSAARVRTPRRRRPAVPSGDLDRANLECYLAELYVVPHERGKGLGRALLDGAMDHARARGADYIDLNADEADTVARALYESLGFSRSRTPGGRSATTTSSSSERPDQPPRPGTMSSRAKVSGCSSCS